MKKKNSFSNILLFFAFSFVLLFGSIFFVLPQRTYSPYALSITDATNVEVVFTDSDTITVSYNGGSEVAWSEDIVISGSTQVTVVVKSTNDTASSVTIYSPNKESENIITDPTLEKHTVSYDIENLSPLKYYSLSINTNGTYSFNVTEVTIYSVSYDLNEGTGTLPTDNTKYKVGEQITLSSGSEISRTGYTFVGWSTSSNALLGSTGSYTIKTTDIQNNSITFYAIWEKSKYNKGFSITMSDITGATKKNDITITLSDEDLTFDGLFFLKIIPGETEEDTTYEFCSSITEAGSYYIIIIVKENNEKWFVPKDENSLSDTEYVGSITINEESCVGYVIETANYQSDNIEDFVSSSTGDKYANKLLEILFPVEIENKTISFVGGDGATGTAPTSQNQIQGKTITLPANTFTKTGFAFVGWNDGTTTYQAGTSYTVGTTNITLTAVWVHTCNSKEFKTNLYHDFSENYLSSEDGYCLMEDLTLSHNIIIQQNKEIRFCLNGHVLNLNGYKIVNGGSLYICDCENKESSSIRHYFTVDEDNFWSLYDGEGTTEHYCYGGAIINGNCAIESDSYSTMLEIDGVNFIGNKSDESSNLSGVIHMCNLYAELIIKNSNFYGNTTANENYPGAICSYYDTTIENCKFVDNISVSNGGAIFCSGKLTILNCNFEDNKAKYGGAVYSNNSNNIYSGSVTTIDGCNFKNNTVSEDGGAVYANGNTNVYDSTFNGNVASKKGGAVYAKQILIENCSFGNTKANEAEYGGAIYVFDSIATIINSTIKNNKATVEGGGIYVYKNVKNCLIVGTKITMSNGSVKNIEDIKVGDYVQSFNHETGKFENHRVYLAFAGNSVDNYFTLHFESGNSIGICGLHDLFEKSANKYVTITENNYNNFIGKYFYNATNKNWDKLVSVSNSTTQKKYYSIYVEKTFNAIANGMLTIADDVDYMLNMYKFNSDLTVNQAQLQQDILKYGLYTIEECSLINDKELFDNLNLQYLNIWIGKGFVSLEKLKDEFYEWHTEEVVNTSSNVNNVKVLNVTNSLSPIAFATSSTNNFDTYTDGVTDPCVFLGSNTIIKDNTVDGIANNLSLDNDCFVYVINEESNQATNIDVAITMSGTNGLGLFGKEIYTNLEKDNNNNVLVKITSDNATYKLEKVETSKGSGLYNYSLNVILANPTKENDYEISLIEEFDDENVTYKWFRHGMNDDVFEVENETSAKYGNTTLLYTKYYCAVYKNGSLIQKSETILPIQIGFDINGAEGDYPSCIYQLDGRSIDLPDSTNFTKSNYHFAGWNTSPSATSGFSSYTVDSKDVIDDTITFYAVWKIIKTEPSNASGNDYTVVVYEDITNETYQWYKLSKTWTSAYNNGVSFVNLISENGGNLSGPINISERFGFSVGANVYALRFKVSGTATITNCNIKDGYYYPTFNVDKNLYYVEASDIDEATFTDVEILLGTQINGETNAKIGNTILEDTSYYCVVSLTSGEKETSNLVTPKTISFDGNGGSGSIDNIYQLEGRKIVLSTTGLTKTGYNFLGWNTDKYASSALTLTNNEYTVGTNDVTFYAVWELITYSENINFTIGEIKYGATNESIFISFDRDDIKIKSIQLLDNEGTAINSITKSGNYNLSFIVTNEDELPFKMGSRSYGFMSLLFYGGTIKINNADVSGIIGTGNDAENLANLKELSINYSFEVKEITISYNNGSATSGNIEDEKYCDGQSVSLAGQENLLKTNYKFLGWSLANDNDISKKLTSPYTIDSSIATNNVITLYAIWLKEISINKTAQEFTYDGTEKAFNIVGATDNLNDFIITYSVENPTNAGSYNVTITREADETYAEFNITITNGLIINRAKVNEPTIVGTYKFSGDIQTVSLIGVESYMLTTDSLTQKNIGIYTITFNLDNNHEWAENSDGVITWEIRAASISPKTEDTIQENVKQKVIIETEEGFSSNISVVVEITVETEIEQKELTVDYYNLDGDKKLASNEKVGVVFDVKLKKNGEVVSLSSLEGVTSIKVKMLIPETVDISKVTRILHVHSAGDIEEIEFDASKVDENGYYEIEIDRLSEFAFIYQSENQSNVLIVCVIGGLGLLLIALLLVLFLTKRKVIVIANEKVVKEFKFRPLQTITFNGEFKDFNLFTDRELTKTFTQRKIGFKSIVVYGKNVKPKAAKTTTKKSTTHKTTEAKKVSKTTKKS